MRELFVFSCLLFLCLNTFFIQEFDPDLWYFPLKNNNRWLPPSCGPPMRAPPPPPHPHGLQEALLPEVSAYKSFNQFFYRKLKPSARPIAAPGDLGVVVSAADCRCAAYVH